MDLGLGPDIHDFGQTGQSNAIKCIRSPRHGNALVRRWALVYSARMPLKPLFWKAFCLGIAAAPVSFAGQAPSAAKFNHDVKPVLSEFCSDCHFDGAKKGNVALDEFKSDDELLAKKNLWFSAIKNVRAGLMPPAKKPRPSQEQIDALVSWVKGSVFEIDPEIGRAHV